MTLLDFVRARGLTGAKEGCAEGECGACAVALVEPDGDRSEYRVVNSCLMFLPMAAGREIYTVESLAAGGELSDAQRAMAAAGGSQCGYCTPGFVISLFAEQYRSDRTGRCDPMALAGNLCRCTGYRPIRDAAHSLGPAPDDQFRERLGQRTPRLDEISISGFSRPATVDACLSLLRDHPDARLVAGATDLGSRVQPALAPLAASRQRRSDRRAARVFEHGRARHDRRGAAAQRDRPPVVRRSRSVPRMADAVCLAADSQPRDARRQSRHRVADRRCGAAAAGARRPRPYRGTVGSPDDSAVVVLHGVSQDGDGGRASCSPRSRFRSRCRSSSGSTRSRSGGSMTSARSRRRWPSTCDAPGRVRRARFAFGGVAATPLRVDRGRDGDRRSGRGTRRRSSGCSPFSIARCSR